MILVKWGETPSGFISNDKAKLAGTMVGLFTASWESGPLKPLAATTASHTEIKKVLKYRTKEFGFISKMPDYSIDDNIYLKGIHPSLNKFVAYLRFVKLTNLKGEGFFASDGIYIKIKSWNVWWIFDSFLI